MTDTSSNYLFLNRKTYVPVSCDATINYRKCVKYHFFIKLDVKYLQTQCKIGQGNFKLSLAFVSLTV